LYLKRLEIHGFKSFADKVVLDFREGVSVVVGPNGSGKSNISDAIRWVLGEQSAKSLRGAKMEDIIFAGSVKRRAVGMAEVSLTLDNSTGIFPVDFVEITVTRRVFRSGESEYLINKSPCRLKDVHELFMDTGIGREGFSIIGQGRVEEILSSKPEDRRNLIEEAAGVTKYRNRKREATRKLDETENNLVRLADIIGELEAQLAPLEEQAEKARHYQGLKQELDELELDLYVHDIEDLGGKLAGCKQQISVTQQNMVSMETQLRVTEAETAELKLSLQELDEQIYLGQTNCHNLSSQIQQLESELKLCDERSGAIAEQQHRLQVEAGDAKQKNAALQAEFAAEEAKVRILQHTRKELESQLRDKEAQLAKFSVELGSAESNIENLKNEVFEVLSQSAKYNNELTALNQQEDNLSHRKQVLDSQKLARDKEQAQVTSLLKEVTTELGGLRDQVNQLVLSLSKFKVQQEQLSVKRRELQTSTAGVKDKLHAASSRLKVLSDMQKDFEGYNRGVKEILQAASRGTLKGICGVVAELINVPARLETALEVVLGGSLQNVVSVAERDAKQAISFLKNNHYGRATFLPLDTLQPSNRSFEGKVLKAPGVLGVAADLVEYEPRYKPVVEYLLGRTLVVENLEQATQVAKLGGYKLRIVTLEGEQLSPGGSMTGGSLQRRSSSLLGRHREIAELEDKVSVLRREFEQQNQQERELLEQQDSLLSQQSTTQAALKELELSVATLDTRRANLTQDNERAKREVGHVLLELEQLLDEADRFEAGRQKLNVLKAESQAAYDELSKQLAQTQDKFRDQGTARERLVTSITELKIKVASLEQEEKGLQTALERYYQQKEEYQAVLANRQREHEHLEQRKEEIAREVLRLRENLSNLVNSEARAQENSLALRDQRQDMLAALESKETGEKNLRQQLQVLQETLHSTQVREARLDTEVNTALNRLQESLQLSLEEAKTRSKPVVNRRDVVIRVNRVKSEIGNLGSVNLGAVEEFDRVQERYSFLFVQQEDLQQAKASLFNVIAEMDRIMVERFGKAFALIKERFGDVFVELFGGGHAELQLTDPENLLETGVEIIAQPPGKKTQHLSLLSGGEKALTAIALLFAILQIKPSPFCVLDEIEAALDEANVSRFATYLKDLCSLTQFIVISHRKGTMEVADVLYGVTMEENGISKLYSVRMAENEATLAG
jgi:chromosome segregation protein